MSGDFNLQRQQAILYSLLEDSVNFEVEQIKEVKGKGILSFIKNGQRSLMAINELYILNLMDFLEKDAVGLEEEYNLADLDFLADYITNKYPLRAKIQDFMSKVRSVLKD